MGPSLCCLRHIRQTGLVFALNLLLILAWCTELGVLVGALSAVYLRAISRQTPLHLFQSFGLLSTAEDVPSLYLFANSVSSMSVLQLGNEAGSDMSSAKCKTLSSSIIALFCRASLLHSLDCQRQL